MPFPGDLEFVRRVLHATTTVGDTVCDPAPTSDGQLLAEARRLGCHTLALAEPPELPRVLARTPGTGTRTVLTGAHDPAAADLPGPIDLIATALTPTHAGLLAEACLDLCERLTITSWLWPGGHIAVFCPATHHGQPLHPERHLTDLARAHHLTPITIVRSESPMPAAMTAYLYQAPRSAP